MGVTQSGLFFLDPDGPGGYGPVRVHCDMRRPQGQRNSGGGGGGVARVEHDTVGEMRVASCRERGCFVHRVRRGRRGHGVGNLPKCCFMVTGKIHPWCHNGI